MTGAGRVALLAVALAVAGGLTVAVVRRAVVPQAAAVVPQTPVPERYPPPLVRPLTVALSRHAFVIPDPEIVLVPNIGIVVGRTATLVVDTGVGPRNARAILREVARLSPNRRLYLTVTHAHPDHVSGLAGFPPGTTFLASRALQQDLDVTGMSAIAAMARLTPVIGGLLRDAPLRRADVIFDGEYRLDLGGVTVRLVPVGPAHTPGDTAVLVEGDGVLYAGDVVLNQRFPSVPAQGRTDDWYAAFDRVARLQPTTIVPAHGALGTAALIEEQRRMLQSLERRVRTLKREGRSRAETARQVDQEFRQRYPRWKATVPNEIPPIVATMYGE